MILKDKNILFFTASFLGFQNDIREALEAMGARVKWFDERLSTSTFTKAMIRLNRNLLSSKIYEYYNDIIEETKYDKYDYIFFVNIEAVSSIIIDKMKDIHPEARFILYEWDSIHNNKNALSVLDRFDNIWSFDKEDCKQFKMNFLPLFYNNEYSQIKKDCAKPYDVMFVGTVHSGRYSFVKKIMKQVNPDADKSFNWFYFPSKLLYYKTLLMDTEFRKLANSSDFRYTPLTKKELIQKVSETKVVIDAQHPKQTGLTMRTLETLGARRKLITTNQYVKEYDFYNHNNILVVDRDNPIVSREFIESSYEDLPKDVYEKYSLNSWLKTIFEINS